MFFRVITQGYNSSTILGMKQRYTHDLSKEKNVIRQIQIKNPSQKLCKTRHILMTEKPLPYFDARGREHMEDYNME